ncbi:hypothetical protein BDZ89DRAFT_1064321, partial [Hymenopellis radicata]
MKGRPTGSDKNWRAGKKNSDKNQPGGANLGMAGPEGPQWANQANFRTTFGGTIGG